MHIILASLVLRQAYSRRSAIFTTQTNLFEKIGPTGAGTCYLDGKRLIKDSFDLTYDLYNEFNLFNKIGPCYFFYD